MLLDDAHRVLGWPERDQILAPRGEGSKIYADFTKRKIEASLRRKFPQVIVHTGILAVDPNDDATVAPLAVVCEFPSGAPEAALLEAHRLAWNFSRTSLLITLEPQRLIAWSCCQTPQGDAADRQVCTLDNNTTAQDSVRWLLHRVSLTVGRVMQEQPQKFRSEGRADTTLLANLKVIRKKLLEAKLPLEICHDLLARVIFTQFLFHRRDRDGRPFFDTKLLKSRCNGALKREHRDLVSILRDKHEAYAMFRWLDNRFNGDLFPGKGGQSKEALEKAWRAERDAVTDEHLGLLADLVSGKVQTNTGQMTLWPQYSFDVIPLEFISSVYEEFLGEEREDHKAYYTPAHLVDYVLDAVLPWNSDAWNVKVLDPACGSGIFLVKAFQRLIYRWRRVHKDRDPLVSDLKPILEQNIVGIDRHREAVRVACFSLYLAMADAIEPRYYLKRDKVFPRLRGTRLVPQDFFDESTDGIRTKEDAGTFDLVLGNAPWGDGSIATSSSEKALTDRERTPRTLAQSWAKLHGWSVANDDIGPLFLAKGATLVREGGQVAMIQSASLLNLRSKVACNLRRALFTRFTFDEVTNLSILRRALFSDVIGPSAVLVFRRTTPDLNQPLLYLCPKPLHDPQDQHRFVIDPQDVHNVTHAEAAELPEVWTALLFGGRRDLDLVRRLSSLPTLAKLEASGDVKVRQGVIPGNRKRVLDGRTEMQTRNGKKVPVALPDLRGTHYFNDTRFPKNVFLYLDQSAVPKWDDPRTAATDSTNFEAFKAPQLLIKMSYSREDKRMRAVRVRAAKSSWGVICQKTYLSVHDVQADSERLDAMCVAFNSTIVTWYLAMASSRLMHARQEALVSELLDVPLPERRVDILRVMNLCDLDEAAAQLYGLTAADMLLVEDCIHRKLPQAQRSTDLSGHLATNRSSDVGNDHLDLVAYANCILRVLSGTFGPRRKVCATIYEETGGVRLPVRMVGLTLDGVAHGSVATEPMTADGLLATLQEFYEKTMKVRARDRMDGGLGVQRVAFLFDRPTPESGLRLYIVKPDQQRYWMQSVALHDADQLTGAILRSAAHARSHA